MKVLFAVNNDEISDAIIKKYQKEYKEILSYKNVYYFNAILKELQKDKSYDRVVISEDLEPFANNNYDTIDKFLFERLDKISDEATDEQGESTDIILICTDRRGQSDDMLIKLFGIGIYSALIGKDRKIEEVCRLINKPRIKKDAKQYYKIDADNVNYQVEDENNVSEAEVQNILAHYKRLGKNEDKFLDSFNNIVSQYNDNQLRIIIRYLPIGVKAVLEERSPKYQELVTFGSNDGQTKVNLKPNQKELGNKAKKEAEETIKVKMLDKEANKKAITKPIIIPSSVSKSQVKRLIKEKSQEEAEEQRIESPKSVFVQEQEEEKFADLDNIVNNIENNNSVDVEIETNEPKKGRGRPRKYPIQDKEKTEGPKRGRGRPRKNADTIDEEISEEEVDLFSLSNESNNPIQVEQEESITKDEGIDLFGLNNEEETRNEEDEGIDLFGLDDEKEKTNNDEDIDLFGLDDEKEEQELDDDLEESETITKPIGNSEIVQTGYKQSDSNFNTLLTKDKKVIAFVGTTKNGTSFVVNNLGEMLSSMGISTAILDLTKSKNAYYIYTNNEEELRKKAENSIYKLKSGIADGVKANKNLTIYTGMPTEEKDYTDAKSILGTLVQNYSIVLIDCDFNTPIQYFENAQELYIVQSMDVLTIQPLTAFLRNLKAKNIIRQDKLKIVINKYQKMKSLSVKTLIGGIAFYNDPGMSYMTELFNKDIVNYCIIPFETQNYIKYLESLVNCSVSLSGYTKTLIGALKDLANMAYPLINKQTYSPRGDKYKDSFPNEMNDTLNKMKNKYQP